MSSQVDGSGRDLREMDTTFTFRDIKLSHNGYHNQASISKVEDSVEIVDLN